MIRKKIEKKYAKALFDILISEKEYEKNYTQLMQLNSFFKSETEIFEFLCNPINNLANKTDIVRKMIDMLTLMPLNVKFLNIVIKKHVLVYFSGIVEELENSTTISKASFMSRLLRPFLSLNPLSLNC